MSRTKIQHRYEDYPPHLLRRTYINAMRQGKVFDCGICNNPIVRRDPKGRLTIDHIIPIAQGGSHEYENLQPAHQRCNARKGCKGPELVFDVYKPNDRAISLQNTNALVILQNKA